MTHPLRTPNAEAVNGSPSAPARTLTPTESALFTLWTEAMGNPPASVDDPIAPGSLSSTRAVQIAAQVRELFHVELAEAQVTRATSIAELAEAVNALRYEALLARAQTLQHEDNHIQQWQLSPAQERLWFLEQFSPGSDTYNMPSCTRLKGVLNIEALTRSINGLIERHESLRTRFVEVDGQARVVIDPQVTVTLNPSVVPGATAAEREAALMQQLLNEAQHGFDLAKGPLVRARLWQLTPTEHVLLLTFHHIIADGWSLDIIMRELALLYKAHSAGGVAALPDLPIQYVDFAAWQQDWLASADNVGPQLDYWKKQLASLPPLALPTDTPRPATATKGRGAMKWLTWPTELQDAVRRLAKLENATVFMVLLAALQILIARHSEQDDIIVGSPIAGRQTSDVEGVVGFFINTVALRTRFKDIEAPVTFSRLLAYVRDLCLSAYANQDVPFERLVDRLHPVRERSLTPLFQVMLVMQNAPFSEIAINHLHLSNLALDRNTPKFDLALLFTETEQGLVLGMEYDTDLFKPETMQRWAAELRVILETATAAPDTRVNHIALLTPLEHKQIINQWSNPLNVQPETRCIHELFELQAHQHPDAIAVIHNTQQISYRKLDRRANQLAHFLQKRGVGPDVLVGLCVERSLELAVGLLGILKAGGAYLPIDPLLPKDRLTFMLQDANVPLLLTQTTLVEKLPDPGCTIVCLDADWAQIAVEASHPPVSGVTAEHLAYVTYTSGTTGRPKGSQIPHRSIPGFIWNVSYVKWSERDTWLQYSSISWDALTLELWPALLLGGRCVLYPGQGFTPNELSRVIQDHQISVLWLTSALFNVALDSVPEIFETIPQLLVGGEVVSLPHIRRTLSMYPHTRLVNGYGPSECTVFTSCYPIPGSLPAQADSISIGRPIGDRRVYLLDKDYNVVPVGMPGELFVGGPCVARGYHQRPELTAEKFVPDPFSSEPGLRLYRSGDLCRWQPDGSLEFVGRIDHQVKIRGFRVELGEIEAWLGQHPAVSETAVLALTDDAGQKHLVAYVVFKHEVATSELRTFLRENLPEYMVPVIFVTLEAMPLTSTGKINRRALPDPEPARPELEGAYIAPRSPLEEELALIWAEVLSVERVGIEDNFFELGGHSLLLTQLMSHIRTRFNVELPLRALFETPTVEELSLVILQKQSEQIDDTTLAELLTQLENQNNNPPSTGAPE